MYCPKRVNITNITVVQSESNITNITDLQLYPICEQLAESNKLRPTLGALEEHIKHVRDWCQAPDAQTIWIYHASPHPPHSAHPEDCTNPHCASYPSATPHTSISPSSVPSFLSRLCRCAFFITQVSVPYDNTLWTQAFNIFPFVRYDAPWAVRLRDIFLNFAEFLALAASSKPLPAPLCRPNSKTWGHIPTSHWAQSQPLSAKPTGRGHSHMQSSSCNGNQHYSSNSCNATTSSVNPLANCIRHSTHKIELSPTPFLQTPQGCSLESSASDMLTLHHMIFVFPAFTLRLFFSNWSHFNFDNNFLSEGGQYNRKIRKNINISIQKPTKILKFYYTNLLTSFHNAMKLYGRIEICLP